MDGQVRIDAGHQALTGGFFIACGAIDLAREEKASKLLGLQTSFQLGRREEVVLNRVAGTEHLGFLESWNLPHGFELDILRKTCRESIDVDLYGIPSFWFNKDLMPLALCEAVDFIFYGRTVSRTDALYASVEHG